MNGHMTGGFRVVGVKGDENTQIHQTVFRKALTDVSTLQKEGYAVTIYMISGYIRYEGKKVTYHHYKTGWLGHFIVE